MRLGDATWNDIEQLIGKPPAADGTLAPVVLVPVGSTEQHGPHLPLATDTLIAEELVARAVHRTDGLLVGPTLPVTAAGEHAGFPGTLSVGAAVTARVLLELGRSADWAAGIVFVNGHGGNSPAVARAVDALSEEGRAALAWWPRWPRRDDGPRDLHAGRVETSMMLAIDPGLVRLELAVAGVDASIEELRERGVRAVSPTGVLGDPAGATGTEGESLINRFVDDLVHAIERWRPAQTPAG
jgi:mycofactocin system creatininase family protein